MARLLVRWCARSLLLILVVSALTFVLVSFTPGDAARTILGSTGSEAQYEALRTEMGLDRPLAARYADWLAQAARGDLGASLFSGEPVGSLLAARVGTTVSLIVGALLLSSLIGISLGVYSAARSGWAARLVDVLSLGGAAVPPFWLGLVLAAVFAVQIRWFPVVGYTSLADSPTEWLRSLVLPVTTLALGGVAILAKQTRDAVGTELGRDYVLMLRAHGTPERVVLLGHVLRNAAVPIVTVLGVLLIGLLSGTVLVEAVFAMPGLGGLAVTSTVRHDLPVVQGVTVLFCLVVVGVNLLVDLAYAWLNPKVRT